MSQTHPGDGRIEISLTTEERDLILRNREHFNEDIRSKLVFGVQRDGQMSYRLTFDDMDTLIRGLLTAAESCGNENEQQIFGRIFNRMNAAVAPLLEAGECEFRPSGSDVNPVMAEILERVAKKHSGVSFKELSGYLEEEVAQYNVTPVDVFQGLNPLEVACLLQRPKQCVILNENLSLEDLADASILRHARIFLGIMAEEKAKATAKGNLNRRFVKRIAEALYPDDPIRLKYWVTGDRNETDLWSIHVLRVVLGIGGYLRKHKGHFVVTKKGARALEEDQAGAFYADLFRTMFTETNLEFVAGGPDWPSFQLAFFYAVAQMGRHGRKWTDERELGEKVVFPDVIEEFPAHPNYRRAVVYATRSFLFSPLQEFGLIEEKREIREEEDYMQEYFYRVTPLYDRFFRFEYSDEILNFRPHSE